MAAAKDRQMNVSQISIVGAGIGGLTAALALQHFGYRVRVFEQARGLREVGAGVAISPNAMHALNFLGVGERVAKEAGPAGVYVSRHFQTGSVLKVRQNDFVERFGAAYHQVHRVDLQVALASAVLRNEPDCVFLDYCFDSLTQDSERVVATFSNGKTVTSDVLIGCYDEIQGATARGPNPGADPVDRGLYSYNPVKVPLTRTGETGPCTTH